MATVFTYVPIVKAKANDIKAVAKLPQDLRKHVKPLIEVLPYLKPGVVDDYLDKTLGYISKDLTEGAFFLDMYGFLPKQKVAGGTSAIIAGFKLLNSAGRYFTPVYELRRDDSLWPQIKTIVETNKQGFCFRLERDDLDDASEETWTEIIQRTTELGLKPSAVDIVIDFKDVRPVDVPMLKDLVVDFLMLNSKAKHYRSIVVAGSSALRDVSTIGLNGIGAILRNELFLWSLLRRDIDETVNLIFGDYGVVHPRFSGAGRGFLNMNAKVRYTAGAYIHYFRGHGLLRPTKDFVQFRGLAKKVRSHSSFKGAQCSYGDAYIEDCADSITTPGNAATWVLADMSHHLTYTTRQMQQLMSAVLMLENDNQLMALIEKS